MKKRYIAISDGAPVATVRTAKKCRKKASRAMKTMGDDHTGYELWEMKGKKPAELLMEGES